MSLSSTSSDSHPLESESLISDEKHHEELSWTTEFQRARKTRLLGTLRLSLICLPWVLLPIVYILTYHYAHKNFLPSLTTDSISGLGDAFRLHITALYDGEGHNINNQQFKGQPRQELDDAWMGLMEHSELMIDPEAAKSAGFISTEWPDGSGKLMGFMTIHHHLHCLLTIRRLFWPEVYTGNWNQYKPSRPGEINSHIDHCIDNLRQAIMCYGDTSIWAFASPDGERDPIPPPQHRCVDWDRLDGWAKQNSFKEPPRVIDYNDPRYAEYKVNYSAVVHVPRH